MLNELNQQPIEAVATPAVLVPIALTERIEALDVIRGFALIGIFFMNIEWFNRTMNEFGNGIPTGLSSIDWAAHYFVNFFVAGKFWTIFSLLFGMGFAVMLTRSEESGRAFLVPYIRRIIALAIFGALHQILLWPGDILLSYAFTAAGLLIILFANWKVVIISMLVFVAICFIPGFNLAAIVVVATAYMGLIALYVRNEKLQYFAGYQVPVIAIVLGIFGLLLAVFGGFSLVVPDMQSASAPVIGMAIGILVTAFLSAKYHRFASQRLVRAGAWLYVMPFLVGIGFGIVEYQKPVRNILDNPAAQKLADQKQIEKAANDAKKNPEKEKNTSASTSFMEEKKKEAEKKAKMSAAEKKLDAEAEKIVQIREGQKNSVEEVKVLTKGSYKEFVTYRATEFSKKAFQSVGTAFLAIAMFMIGVWAVKAQIITRVKEHLPLFRKLALFGLPVGLGLSVLASSFAVRSIPGHEGGGNVLEASILNLANFPTCLAYVSLVILALYSNTIFSKIKVLAPFGRMALTNYLSQSLIQASVFYGWGLGYFGMGRAQQLGFAVVVILCQIVFSHLWLSQFRYGPMEWLWRAITYWKIPAFRL